MVDVSIVVIFDQFRREKIVRLLESMRQQLPDKGVEVLLVQESDVSLEQPMGLPVAVRHITIPAKQGIAFNRNEGIKYTQGEIIVFIDDDCWVQEKWFEALLSPLKKKSSLLAVTSGTKIPHSNFLGDCISALGFPGGGSLGFEKVWKVSLEGFTNHLAVGNCALRRSIFEKVGMFDQSMKFGAEDAEFSFRLEKAGIPICYAAEAYAFHEARTTWKAFVAWQLRRGRANYHFQKKVGEIKGFVKLRLWSGKNVLNENMFRLRFPVVVFLLFASFFLQQWGYFREKMRVASESGNEKLVVSFINKGF